MNAEDAAELHEQLVAHIAQAFPDLPEKSNEPAQVIASRFVWRDPSTIPRREFLYGTHLIRKFVSGTVSPGGIGKSSLVLAEAMAMAAGKNLLGDKTRQPLGVWYWNGEDPLDELERRVHAIAIHNKLEPADFAPRLWLDSGRESPIKIARQERGDTMLVDITVGDLEAEIKANGIDVLVIDPFVSAHAVGENDNAAIDVVAKALGGIADRTNCAIELVHHVRKGRDSEETQAEDARGASAFVDACRSVRTLTRMSLDIAQGYGISDKDRKRYFFTAFGKANLAPPADREWHELVGVGLGNGGPFAEEDQVAVVTRWDAPPLWEGVKLPDVRRVQEEVAAGNYRMSSQANDWVGNPVARALGLNLSDKKDAKRIRDMIRKWIDGGALILSDELDEHRKLKTWVRSGPMVDPNGKPL